VVPPAKNRSGPNSSWFKRADSAAPALIATTNLPRFTAPLELEEELLLPDDELVLLATPELVEVLDDELEEELPSEGSMPPQPASARLQMIAKHPLARRGKQVKRELNRDKKKQQE